MAINRHCMELIARAGGSGCAASLGYPDLLLSEQEIIRYCGTKANGIPARKDSSRIASWHGVALEYIYESKAFFKALGYDLDVYDVKEIRGDEIIVDLNYPLPAAPRQKYSLVIDPGTCEHCFHVGQAAMNVADMCEQGGHIVQTMPLNAYNHGFYCVSPTWVRDFYEDNGFDILACFGISGERRFALEHRKRVRSMPENAYMLTLVRRNEVRELRVPTQFKYR